MYGDCKLAVPSADLAAGVLPVMWSFWAPRTQQKEKKKKKKKERLLFQCLWQQYPSSEYIFLHPLGTQRLMEHESGISLGAVWLSHAPVRRGAAGNGSMRLRPSGHAGGVWANSGVNIDGSNWRTAQQGISYISVPCATTENIVIFQVKRRGYLYVKGPFSFWTPPDTQSIYRVFCRSQIYWLKDNKTQWSCFNAAAAHVKSLSACSHNRLWAVHLPLIY